MDANTIRDAFQHVVLVGCGVGLSGLAIVSLAMWARRTPRRICVLAKRFGWGTVAMLFSLGVWATINGYPTQEDKDDYNSQQQQMSVQNAALGSILVNAELQGTMVHAGKLDDRLMREGGLECLPNEAEEPSVRSLTAEDYAAGLALSRIGANESHDFSAPPCAEVCEDWRSFGASRDWFRTAFTNGWGFAFGTNRIDALTVFSYGTARPKMRNKTTFFSPMESNLGVVPEANWYVLTNGIQSFYWQCLTPSNTFVMTWQNVLLDRRSCSPISFQMEFEESGDITFRYDLSALQDEVVSNLVVGVSNCGIGRTFTKFNRNTTSLKWSRLDPTRSDEPDPDGDGITTDDELLVYHTDPYAADSDMDGLSDGEEIFETNTDPNNPHSLSDTYCDGVAVKIGDLDPFVCPEGSTNTVWEHVFYTGTTNAPFAYPQSTDETAVLRVSVSGTGSGELIVGNRVVPLLSPPVAQGPARAKSQTAQNGGTSLLVPIEKGQNIPVILRGDGSLSVDLDSDDFAFGVLPSWEGRLVGFVNFPNTVAETPCIHDFNARRKRISLPVGDGAELLTCTWRGEDDVRIENRPPRSALVTADFSARTTRDITYTLDHPYYLFGATTYDQTVRFCPRPPDPDPDAPNDSDPSWYDEGEGVDETDGGYDERWCCYWGLCDDWCGCGCDCAGSSDDEDLEGEDDFDEACPVHNVPYEDCASYHAEDYSNAVENVEHLGGVLYIRDPPLYESIHLDVPTEHRNCCPCPDHWTNHVGVAYKSYRLSLVDGNGQDFSSSETSCDVRVAGIYPSSEIGDAELAFARNGELYRRYGKTVLGVSIKKSYGTPLNVYNSLSSDFGVPFTVTDNPWRGLQLDLATNVKLPGGNIHLELQDVTGQFTVWYYDSLTGSYRVLLDSDTVPVKDITPTFQEKR